MVSGKTKIKNPTGLHLRPAGLFCKTAMQFASKITVRKQARNEEVKMCIRDRNRCADH